LVRRDGSAVNSRVAAPKTYPGPLQPPTQNLQPKEFRITGETGSDKKWEVNRRGGKWNNGRKKRKKTNCLPDREDLD